MDIENLKKTTFEVVDPLGNVYDYSIELVESVVAQKHGILITFIDRKTKKCRDISIRTFMNTFGVLEWFCCIRSNIIIKTDQVAYTNLTELFFKMKSSDDFTGSVSGMQRYRKMKKNVEWNTSFQLEFPFPD